MKSRKNLGERISESPFIPYDLFAVGNCRTFFDNCSKLMSNVGLQRYEDHNNFPRGAKNARVTLSASKFCFNVLICFVVRARTS